MQKAFIYYSGKLMPFLLIVLLLFVATCGGGGSGSASSPTGNNPGTPSSLQLIPEKSVAQTGSFVYLRAKVLDANGSPLSGQTVNFTNESNIGNITTVSSKGESRAASASTTTAKTGNNGIASVRVRATTAGYVTIVVEIEGLRDKRSFYFTSSASLSGLSLQPIMIDVDIDAGDLNGKYNEADDFKVCLTSDEEVIRIRTTVYFIGARQSGVELSVSTDAASLIAFETAPFGTDSDGDGDYDVDTLTTDTQGEAFTDITVFCAITGEERYISILANTTANYFLAEFESSFSGNGGTSLFLQEVTVDSVDVSAEPTEVEQEKTSKIKIVVVTNLGDPPDGTIVQVSTTCGTVDETAPTTVDGIAFVEYTAPSTFPPSDTCIVKAKVGGVSKTVTLTIYEPLDLVPETFTIDGRVGGTITYIVNGGVPTYTITSSDSTATDDVASWTVTTRGGTFTVTVPEGTPASSVTLTVLDSIGNTDTATLEITAGEPLSLSPTTTTVTGTPGTTSYTISGGTSPYTVTGKDLAVSVIKINGDIPPVTLPNGTTTFIVTNTHCPGADTTYFIEVSDANTPPQTAVASYTVECP